MRANYQIWRALLFYIHVQSTGFGAVLKRIRPQGVFSVGVLTALGALGLLLTAYIIFDFGQSAGASVTTSWVFDVTFPFGCGGVLYLVDSVLILRGIRFGYFLSMVLWVLTLVSVVLWGLSLSLFNSSNFSVVELCFLCYALYSIVCFTYFIRPNVRTYFGV